MTEKEANEAVLARWIASWSSLQPLVPFCFENEAALAVDTWARVKAQFPGSRQVSTGPVGTRRFERTGTIFVQLFVPVDQGTAALLDLVQAVRTTFESQQLAADLWTYATGVAPAIEDGRWFMRVCSTPVTFYETR